MKKINILKNKKLNSDKDTRKIPKYETLNPVKNIKEIKSKDALDFAFLDDDIRNIAITGNYSSGKSSTLFSYIENNFKEDDKERYVTISLATFQSKEKKDANITIQELEKEIIQQLYYNVYNCEVLKKWIILFFMSISTSIILSFLFMYFFSSKMIIFFPNYKKILFLVYIVILLICIVIFYKIYEFTNLSVKIDGIEINGNNDSSNNILNMNLDFIFKLFSMHKSKMKYIIFEDLDRFEEPIIFEHLRELNFLLNKTWPIKFIYVLNDDVFKDENRTKFFDFIYPIVPVISYGTSGEILNELIRDVKIEELSTEFINNITMYIQDMRILKNVLNEYRIYKNELDGSEKLFSMILYKNVFSEDFRKLQNKQGNLYKLLNSKQKIIKKLKDEIEELENKIRNKKSVFSNEKLFCTLVEREIEKNFSDSGEIILRNCTLGTRKLEREINLDYEYLNHRDTKIPYHGIAGSLEQFLRSCDKQDLLDLRNSIDNERKEELRKIEDSLSKKRKELENMNNMSISELLKNNEYIKYFDLDVFNDNIENENIRRKELVIYLVQNKYIDENYSSYIERHYGWNQKDYIFLGNVMINMNNNFSDLLVDSEKIISNLKEEYFKNEGILNINILKTLFSQNLNDYEEKISNFRDAFIKSKDFINNMETCRTNLDETEKEKIYKNFSKNYKFIKNIIEKKEINLFIDVIRFIDIDKIDIIDIPDKNELSNKVNECTILLSKQFDKHYDTLIKLFTKLNVKMESIALYEFEKGKLYEYCLRNNMYKISLDNIQEAINTELKGKNKIISNNYNSIMQTKCVKDYINSNIKEYLEHVYFDSKKRNETKDSIIELLNNKDITKKDKIKIMQKEENKKIIDDILLVQNEELYQYLIEYNVASANYFNISNFMQKSNMNVAGYKSILTDFINSNKLELKNTENELSIKESQRLFEFVYSNENIDNEIYEDMIKKLSGTLDKLDFNNLTNDKISILIKSIVNNNNYNISKEIYTSIIEYIFRNNKEFDLKIETISGLLPKCEHIIRKIQLVNLYIKNFDKEHIKKIVDEELIDYNTLLKDKSRPTYMYNDDLKKFIDNLVGLGYNIKYKIKDNKIYIRGTVR